MGPKSAPSYFQQHMSTTVLAGLVHDILEVYLDDIVVYASTQNQLIERLQLVFDRLEKFTKIKKKRFVSPWLIQAPLQLITLVLIIYNIWYITVLTLKLKSLNKSLLRPLLATVRLINQLT